MPQRASLDELLEFANRVREAGGGNPLDALMPAVPEDPSQCLIAKNLNFNCYVDCDGGRWYMGLSDQATRDAIAKKLDLPVRDRDLSGAFEGHEYQIILPPEIGQVAADFDDFTAALRWNDDGVWVPDEDADEKERENLRDFWPYVAESTKEAFANASFVNEDGQIVI